MHLLLLNQSTIGKGFVLLILNMDQFQIWNANPNHRCLIWFPCIGSSSAEVALFDALFSSQLVQLYSLLLLE
jgi:hypothetical protein